MYSSQIGSNNSNNVLVWMDGWSELIKIERYSTVDNSHSYATK